MKKFVKIAIAILVVWCLGSIATHCKSPYDLAVDISNKCMDKAIHKVIPEDTNTQLDEPNDTDSFGP